jgi:Putative adhesin
VSVTEDAEAAPPHAAEATSARRPGRARRASPWWWLVGGSALVLVAVAGVLGVWWVASSETRIATYRVIGHLSAVNLDLGPADIDVVGGAGTLEVRRTDRFAFGRRPEERRRVDGDVLRIASRCDDTVIGTCRSSYRVAVPDNVQVNVFTTSGRVVVDGLNGSARIFTGSGPIAVEAFCGFSLTATSASGDVRAATSCSPDRIQLRSSSGDVRADVPAGRYQVEVVSDRGTARVRGVTAVNDASFRIEALSASGDVTVEGGR